MGSAIRVPVFEPVGRRRHRVRTVLLLLLALGIVLLVALLGAAWYFSGQLLDVSHDASYTTQVLAVSKGAVTLARNDDTVRPGTYGIEWPTGHAILGHITARSSGSITRAMWAESETLHPGTSIRVTASIYQTPTDVGLTYQRVHYRDSMGPMPAWYLPARGRVWVIIMHGYKSEETEGIRPMPVYHALGMPILDISYRNDPRAPQSPDHLYHLGATEWKDLQAAATYARTHGATGLVLMGYSTGGNLAEEFLHHSRDASLVRAVVLDSPALDWSAVLDLQARERNLPAILTQVGTRVVAYRLGLTSLAALNTVNNARSLRTPTMYFDGGEDTMVPRSVAASFLAHAQPGLVTFIAVPRAGHTEAWNVGPRRYETALRTFLTRALHLKTTTHR